MNDLKIQGRGKQSCRFSNEWLHSMLIDFKFPVGKAKRELSKAIYYEQLTTEFGMVAYIPTWCTLVFCLVQLSSRLTLDLDLTSPSQSDLCSLQGQALSWLYLPYRPHTINQNHRSPEPLLLALLVSVCLSVADSSTVSSRSESPSPTGAFLCSLLLGWGAPPAHDFWPHLSKTANLGSTKDHLWDLGILTWGLRMCSHI